MLDVSSPPDLHGLLISMMGSLGFALFVALNAVLFLRPAELISSMENWPVYEVTILCCLAVLLPRFVEQFRPGVLQNRSTSLCVFGLLLAVPLSFLGQFEFGAAPAATFGFFKIVVTYFLMMAAINTADRLRQYLMWLSLWL